MRARIPASRGQLQTYIQEEILRLIAVDFQPDHEVALVAVKTLR